MSNLSTLIFRNNIVESQHSVKCYIGSLNGNTIFSTGNMNDLIYPRSSIKIFQGIPFSDSKAIDFYKLNKKFKKIVNEQVAVDHGLKKENLGIKLYLQQKSQADHH